MASILDQLIFLWSIEKRYVSLTTLGDPPESDELQKKIEETNNLILADQSERDAGPNGQDHGMDRDGQGDGHSTGLTTPRRGTLTDGPPRESRSRTRRRSTQRRRGGGNRRITFPVKIGAQESIPIEVQETTQLRQSAVDRKGKEQVRIPSTSGTGTGRHGRGSGDSTHPRSHSSHPGTTSSVGAGTQEVVGTRQTFLFDALLASDWREKNPKRTKEADLILQGRDVERHWNLLINLTEKWPGGVSKPAFIQFLTKGFISKERPGGFTAFMFSPPRKNKRGKKDREWNLPNVLGKSSEVDEEDLEYYAKNDLYIPKSVYEGEVEIQMAVRTLDVLTNHKSIASDGYRYGLEFLDG
jgi:hypothetical protein